MENLNKLVEELCKYQDELPWIEFKHNNYNSEMIGKSISALSNSAALHDKDRAYMIWGVDDKTHEIVGTEYNLQNLKVGNQELENWLRSLLSNNVYFEFHSTVVHNNNVGVLIIYKAINHTVMFKNIDYIRIGSYTKKLSEFQQIQSQLWNKISNSKFEERPAKTDMSLSEALSYIDFSTYFKLKEIPTPSDINGIGHYMLEEGIITVQDNKLYAITNMGAILFAKKLSDFNRIERKALRIVQYKGNNRIEMQREDTIQKGYASSFEENMKYIEALIPAKEVIDGALRKRRYSYPIIALREIIANALIHQDFSVTGTSPIVEIFENRIEITNSGVPLVDIYRIIDNPPKSRNEKLASLMRKLGICEELGTGWDKIVNTCELQQLPAPKIELYEESIKITLYSEIPFTNLSLEDKLWACYLHSCIMYVQGEYLTNSSLRKRFALNDTSSGSISRLIKEAVTKKIIKPHDPTTAPRYMKYIPIWA